MSKGIKSKKNEKNAGLQIFRMLLCFWVVLFHCLKRFNGIAFRYIKVKKFHVPSFFFISFFYFHPIIKERNSFKMKSRLERLFIPFIMWPIIIWLVNNIFYFIFKTSLYRRAFFFEELIIQLITGRKFFVQLWFLFNLIFLSIFFFIFSFLNEQIFFVSMIFIGIICYIFQHNHIIYNILKNYQECIAYSPGHMVSSFPIAITALISNKINIIQHLEYHRYKSLLLIFVILPFIFLNGLPNTYEGIDKNLFSFFAFFWFCLLPLNKYLNKNLKNIIYVITNYTNGIYCLQIIIYLFLKREFKCSFTFIDCFLIYIICYVISFLGTKIFINYKIKYLFI